MYTRIARAQLGAQRGRHRGNTAAHTSTCNCLPRPGSPPLPHLGPQAQGHPQPRPSHPYSWAFKPPWEQKARSLPVNLGTQTGSPSSPPRPCPAPSCPLFHPIIRIPLGRPQNPCLRVETQGNLGFDVCPLPTKKTPLFLPDDRSKETGHSSGAISDGGGWDPLRGAPGQQPPPCCQQRPRRLLLPCYSPPFLERIIHFL